MTSLERFAPAKLNLYLHVTGRRPDGYHLLDSLVVFADVGDRLRLEPAPDLSLTVEGPEGTALAGEGDNLVLRAARLLAARAGAAAGARMVLEKNLPVASGIGGGSADAAAALLALNRIWKCGLGPEVLAEIGLALGADVPACLTGRPLRMQGIGERLTPVGGMPDLGLVLVNPRVAVGTADVFKRRTGGYSAPAEMPGRFEGLDHLIAVLAAARNDLEAPARSIAPVIGDLLSTLGALSGCRLARMSGSGATCFALFPDRATAEEAAAALRETRPGWWIAAGGLYDGAA